MIAPPDTVTPSQRGHLEPITIVAMGAVSCFVSFLCFVVSCFTDTQFSTKVSKAIPSVSNMSDKQRGKQHECNKCG